MWSRVIVWKPDRREPLPESEERLSDEQAAKDILAVMKTFKDLSASAGHR